MLFEGDLLSLRMDRWIGRIKVGHKTADMQLDGFSAARGFWAAAVPT
jgi:hypothetical protein